MRTADVCFALYCAQVIRWSDATYLEDQDMWRLSGLHRHVTLHVRHGTHVTDFALATRLTFADDDHTLESEKGAGGLVSAHLDVTVMVVSVTNTIHTGTYTR